MKELNQLIKKCDELNYNFNIQYYDGKFNIYIDNNNHQIETEVRSIGGYDNLKDALTEINKGL